MKLKMSIAQLVLLSSVSLFSGEYGSDLEDDKNNNKKRDRSVFLVDEKDKEKHGDGKRETKKARTNGGDEDQASLFVDMSPLQILAFANSGNEEALKYLAEKALSGCYLSLAHKLNFFKYANILELATNNPGVLLLIIRSEMHDKYLKNAAIVMAEEASDDPVKNAMLGLLYQKGVGVEKDLDRSETLLIPAAEKGISWAQFALGKVYLKRAQMMLVKSISDSESEVEEKEYDRRQPREAVVKQLSDDAEEQSELLKEKASILFEAAANQGHAEAYRYSAELLEELRVRSYQGQIREWYQKAADLGDAVAQDYMTTWYYRDLHVLANYEKAIALARQALDQGYASALINLANIFENGDGVKEDAEKAAALYKEAAEHGHAIGLYSLARLYAVGFGVVKDEKKSIELISLAAHQGFAPAQCRLGIMYETGRGVSEDAARAYTLYQLAADQEDVLATEKIYEILRKYPDTWKNHYAK